MHETPLLINVSTGNFEQYIKSLAKTARKNFIYTEKQNNDLTYSKIEYQPTLIEHFMRLWEQQEVSGRNIQWGISNGFIEYLHKTDRLLCFAAYKSDNANDILSVHFIERHGDFVICHPPMFDKHKYNDRYLAKYMWFHLFEYSISDPEIRWLDLGGGNRGTWKDLLINRENHATSYKWVYVPKLVKDNPQNEEPYIVKTNPFVYSVYLDKYTRPENKLKKNLINMYVVWVWYNKKRRIKKLIIKLGKLVDRLWG